jgi:hypothetical protein
MGPGPGPYSSGPVLDLLATPNVVGGIQDSLVDSRTAALSYTHRHER